MSQNLQYNYVGYDTSTGFCHSMITSSYVFNMEGWIEVPVYDEDYQDKYYNFNGDKMFYWDAEFTQLWDECPSHNI